MDKCYYEGPLCPTKSFVFSELSPVTNNDASFLLLAFTRLSETGSRFINSVYTLTTHNISDLDVISKMLTACGFNEFDLLILQYWMSCLAKYKNVDIIPMPKSLPLPEGIVAYFED